MTRSGAAGRKRPEWLTPLVALVAIAVVFVALNYRAYDGFFQDDELDNISWAPHVRAAEFAGGFLKPLFDAENFRPVGHLYFALMGRAFGEDFPPYMTPVFAIHLANGLLLFLLLRRMKIGTGYALAATAFFTWNAGAFEAYWKPMYVFDLLCAFFSLASILLYAHRRWVLSFVAFWCAYKSKELAVMLPVALLAWEFWLGERRYARLIAFFAVAFSFGLQGVLRNPNHDNEYSFRFTWQALGTTAPFYARQLLLLPGSGLLLLPLALLRDRRVWFGLAAVGCFVFVLLFLPGRLYAAYAYLPLCVAAIAMAAASARASVVCAWIALAIWMPFNVRVLLRQQRMTLAGDDEAAAYVSAVNRWAAKNPKPAVLVYDGLPRIYHHWGVTAAWNIAHGTLGPHAYYRDWPEAAKALGAGSVTYGRWDAKNGRLTLEVR